jgi:hypothetical protein
MKLIPRLTTALFCSAIAFGLTIPGDAETTITNSSDKDSIFDQTVSEAKTLELIGSWAGVNSGGAEINLILQSNSRYTG